MSICGVFIHDEVLISSKIFPTRTQLLNPTIRKYNENWKIQIRFLKFLFLFIFYKKIQIISFNFLYSFKPFQIQLKYLTFG